MNDSGSLNVNVQGNYLFSFKQQNAPGLPFENDAGTLASSGHYRWRTTTNFTYVRNMWSAGLRWIHLPSIKDASYATNPATNALPDWFVRQILSVRELVDHRPRHAPGGHR